MTGLRLGGWVGCLPVEWMVCWLVGWVVCWLVGWMVCDWLGGWLCLIGLVVCLSEGRLEFGWFADCVGGWVTRW